MSRIGKMPITVPKNVEIKRDGNRLLVKGPKGELSVDLPKGIDYKLENGVLEFVRASEDKKTKSLHGLVRALTANAIEGVSNGIKKVLKIEGIGYKAEMAGKNLSLSLGFSHPVVVLPPEGITFAAPNPNTIEVSGIDKQLVGETAAVIRKLRKPEPYKGKGIRYDGEYIRRKAGKTAT